jgi:VWFA-related protein
VRLYRPGALLLAAAAAAGQVPTAPGPALEVLAPTSYDIPVGESRIRVVPRNLQPGDTLDFFVDGRKVGSANGPPWEAAWQVGETLTRHSIVVAVLRGGREVARAQVTTRDPGLAATASAQAVSLAPVVTDRSGRFVLGLERKDFTVLDDGRPQQIETFDTVDSPLAVFLVLDVSTSMQPKLDDASAAARAFVEALKPDDRVGLLTFNSGIVDSVGLSLDRSEVLAAIDGALPEGDTAVYDAVAVALRRVRSSKQRKAVVVFTDGDDNRSRFGVDQVIDLARASEVCVYTVAEGTPSATLSAFLERLAGDTGGRHTSIDRMSRLSDAFLQIVRELRSQYYLTYTPTGGKPRSWHNVEVRVSRPGLKVRAKKRYRMS